MVGWLVVFLSPVIQPMFCI